MKEVMYLIFFSAGVCVGTLIGMQLHEFFNRPKPTNADRIRSMSDEELAKFLNDSDGCIYETSDVRCDEDTECSNCIRKWLKSEVTESDTQ